MYNPTSFLEKDPTVIAELIKAYPLGTLITAGPSGLQASQIPFLLLSEGDQKLVAHLARANDHWKDLEVAEECLVVFQGVDNYVTPSWYPSKQETGKVVPTWNYETVQVRGVPKVIQDADWLKNLVTDLTGAMEKKRASPWAVSDAPDDFIDAQLKAIVGLEIVITSIDGKWKMSQNRSAEDAQGVATGLADPNDPHHNPQVATIVSLRNKR